MPTMKVWLVGRQVLVSPELSVQTQVVRRCAYTSLFLIDCIVPKSCQVTVLTLELDSPTLPRGKKLVFNLSDTARLADTKKNPIIIKEGVEYKLA